MCILGTMNIAERDQQEARDREFDRRAQRVGIWFLLTLAPFVLYAILAACGVLPAAPWSPLGQ